MCTTVKSYKVYFDALTDVYSPEIWALESLRIFYQNSIMARLVHRDFENEIASYGDVVNTRKPASFTATRKTDSDDITIQTASATNVPVPLDQHIHVSFSIKDGARSKSIKNLVNEFLEPAIKANTKFVDQVLAGQVYRFLFTNQVGKLGTTITKQLVTDAREVLTTNNVNLEEANFVVSANAENGLLNVVDFTTAEKVGDAGTSLRKGSIGQRMGFNFFTSNSIPYITSTNLNTKTAAINKTAGYAAGSTTLAIDGASGTIYAGEWCTVAGDMTPQLITTRSTNEIIVTPGLKYAVANDAAVTIMTKGSVNLSGGYAAAYAKAIAMDGLTSGKPIKPGQLVSFGNTSAAYIHAAVNVPTTTSLTIDRPLTAAISNDDVIGIGPAGNYCFAFHPNALALVSRPLALPPENMGVTSYVANYDGIGLRVTIGYNQTAQGIVVTVDLLLGVALLDSTLGCAVLC